VVSATLINEIAPFSISPCNFGYTTTIIKKKKSSSHLQVLVWSM
jgi:hypothetical protein